MGTLNHSASVITFPAGGLALTSKSYPFTLGNVTAITTSSSPLRPLGITFTAVNTNRHAYGKSSI